MKKKRKNKKTATKIIERLYTGGCITRRGCYTLDKSVALDVVESILNGEKEYLREYDRLIWLSWDASRIQNYQASKKDIKLWEKALKKENYWNIEAMFNNNLIKKITTYIDNSKRLIKQAKTYKKRRKRASTYIQQREIREKVFKKHGYKCAECGSTDDLTIDHIISVKNNGSNNISNLQVLCRSCNSSKGGR